MSNDKPAAAPDDDALIARLMRLSSHPGDVPDEAAAALRAAQEREEGWQRAIDINVQYAETQHGAVRYYAQRAERAESALAAERERAGRMRDALGALGVIGDGYCFCSHDRDPHKADHEPECRDARAALKEGEGK